MTLLKLSVTALALWLVLRAYDPVSLLELVRRADLTWLVAGGIITGIQLVVFAWRWQILIDLLAGIRVPIWPLVVSIGRSSLLGQSLPSSVGSDTVRIVSIGPRTGIATAARTVLCDRFVGLLTLVVLVVLMLPVFGALTNSHVAFASLALASLGGLIAFTLIVAYRHKFADLPIAGQYAAIIAADLRTMFIGRGYLVLGLSLVTHVLSILLFAAFARAVGAGTSLLDSFLVVPPAQLIAALPISLGGWGMREGAIAAAFSMIGADPAAGVAASILFGLTGPLSGVVTELMAFVFRPRTSVKP